MGTVYGDIQREEKGGALTIWGRCYRPGQPIYSRARGHVYIVKQSWDGSTTAERSLLQPAEHMLHSITQKGIQRVVEMHTSVVVFIGKDSSPTKKVEEYSSSASVVRPGEMTIAAVLDAEQHSRLYAPESVLLETLQSLFPGGYIRVESWDELAVLCEERI